MKQREPSLLPSGRSRRIAFWTRAAVAGAGSVAVAGGALLGVTGHQPAPLARQHAAVRPAPPMQLASTPQNHYWMVAADGGIFAFGAPFHGSTGNIRLNKPIVGMASTPDGGGYWFVASDGGIFNYGDAGFFQSLGATVLNSPIVGMAPTHDGGGYWLVGGDGGIFNFGDAPYDGGLGGQHLPAPIVGMAPTHDGGGYWLAGADGSVYPFGDAGNFGSMRGQALNKPMVGMAPTPDGGGYWLVAGDGGIFAFGDAGYFGSTGNIRLNKPIVGMTSSQTGRGYWFVASDGGLFAYGDALFNGSMGNQTLNQPMVGMAAQPVLFPAHTSIVTGAPTVAANGVAQVSVLAQTVAADGTPLPGDSLTLSVDTPGCGGISPSTGTTDLNGRVAATYTASTVAKTCVLRASETSGPLTGTTTVTQVASGAAAVVGTPSTPTSATADTGYAPGVPATFSITDANGNPVVGALVDFSTSLAHGSVAPTSGNTNGSGVVATVLHDTTAESGVVTATVHNTSVHGSTATITITGGKLDALALTTPSGVVAGTPYTVTAHAFDHWGNAVSPPGADFGSATGTACAPAPSGTVAACPQPSFSAGVANLSVTSFEAQHAATINLSDSTNTYSGSAVSATTSFDIAPGAPKVLTGTSPALQAVHLSDGSTPLGLFFQSFAATGAQSAALTLTLTDTWQNLESTNNGAVAVTLTHNGNANMSDNGTLTAPATLTNGVATVTYTAPDPSMTAGSYVNNWGNGAITWSMPSVTSTPTSVPVTTTNAASMVNSVPATQYTANQVTTSTNGFTVTFKVLPNGTGGPLGGVMVDYTEAGFDGTPAGMAPFTDCTNTTAITSGVTAIPTGGTLNLVTVCPHPAKVNSTSAAYTSSGTVTGWIDGAPATAPTPNSVTSTIAISDGPVSTLTLTTNASSTHVAGSFTLNALAQDAAGNTVQPSSETFNPTFSQNETPTCGGVTQGATLTTPWSSGVGVFTVNAYVTHTGVVLTLTGASSGGTGSYTFNVVPDVPGKVTWVNVPTSFTADQGHAGQGYSVDIADQFCNAIGNQAVTLSTTLTGASASQGGTPATLPTNVTTANSTGGGAVLGRAVFSLFDTVAQTGKLTATAGTGMTPPSATTATITITGGKVGSFTLDAIAAQTVDTPYNVTVHALDHWGNPTNPASATVDTRSTALSRGPAGDVPSVPALTAFSGGTATMATPITSYLAQSAAVMTVHDTNTSDTYAGAAATGTSAAYAIAAGPAARIFAISTNPDYVAPTFTPTMAGESCVFSVAVSDGRGNAVSSTTNNGDHVKVTLSAGSTPDNGTLSTPGQSSTAADTAAPVSLTIILVNGTGQFTYSGPGTPPTPMVQSGTITLSDLTHPALTGLPASINING